tara:strand:- start:1556 stop:2941 length:1386 start_codon:yes stop_codon:yes gene_type:complete
MISQRYYPYFRLGYTLSDLLLLFLVFHFTFVSIFDKIPRLFYADGHILLIISASWILVSIIFDLNDIRRNISFDDQIKIFILGQTAALFILSIVLLISDLEFRRSFIISFCIIEFFILLLNRFCWVALSETMRAAGYNIRNIFLYGSDDEYQELRTWTEKNRQYGYHLNGWFKDVGNKSSENIEKEFSSIVKHANVDHFVLDPTRLNDNKLSEAIDWAEDKGARIHLIEPKTQQITRKLNIKDTFGPFAAVRLRKEPLRETRNRIMKKIYDIFFSLAVMVLIFWWFAPIVYILIKATSKGPGIISQRRIGIDGKEFICYKFRTMFSNKAAEKGLSHLTKKDDPRVTDIGKFLRKTNLDELPQFINVLQGFMSVVGPRPHMVSEEHEIASKIKKYRIRRFIKPGITGLAAVEGFRGGTKVMPLMAERIKYDIQYIEKWSIWLDIKICIKTAYQMMTFTTGAI